jgi:hypothetical protein
MCLLFTPTEGRHVACLFLNSFVLLKYENKKEKITDFTLCMRVLYGCKT